MPDISGITGNLIRINTYNLATRFANPLGSQDIFMFQIVKISSAGTLLLSGVQRNFYNVLLTGGLIIATDDSGYELIQNLGNIIKSTPLPTTTPTVTPTNTKTPTVTPTNTKTPAVTPTNTPTNTKTPTPSVTNTRTPNVTPTNTKTPTPTVTPTKTGPVTPTPTKTATPTATQTGTPAVTPTNTPTPSRP